MASSGAAFGSGIPSRDGRGGAIAREAGAALHGHPLHGTGASGRDEPARDGGADDDVLGSPHHRGRGAGSSEIDVLDPSMRQAAQLAPPFATASAPGAREPVTEPQGARARSLEELLPALVRKIAWAGDRHRGTVRLELGAGAYAGTTLVVHADGGRVRVEAQGTEGRELDELRARLDARLRRHGIDVESVT